MEFKRLFGQAPDLVGWEARDEGGLKAAAERAGASAKNFNNLLASILNATEGIKWQLELDNPARRNFDLVHQAVMGARAQGCAPSARTRPRTPSTILLAEDSTTSRTLLQAWLVKAGYQVEAARDGQEAWTAFQADASRYGLIIADHDMPRMDGLELAAKVREADPAVPILFLSTVDDPGTLTEVLRLQVDEFLTKPFEARLLVDTVDRLCTTRPRAFQARVPAQQVLEGLYAIQAPLPEAGGDLFQAGAREDGSVFFVLADTAGHDPLSLSASVAFRALLGKVQAGLPELRKLALWCNRSIQSGPYPQVPIRALFGHWVPRKGRLHLLSAGMPQPVWHKAAWARCVPIPVGGTPLGLLAEPRIEEKVVWLRQGDRVLLGGEGFFKAMGPARTPFQEDAASLWRSLAATGAPQALELIAEAARAHGADDGLLAAALEQPTLYLGPDEIAFSFPSDPRVLDEACNVLGTFLESRGWLVRSDRFASLMAVREALTNAMNHGNAAAEAASIHLRAQKALDGGFQVLVLDEGLGFDLDAYKPQVALVSGLDGGIPLIRQFTKKVSMVGGELTMTFN